MADNNYTHFECFSFVLVGVTGYVEPVDSLDNRLEAIDQLVTRYYKEMFGAKAEKEIEEKEKKRLWLLNIVGLINSRKYTYTANGHLSNIDIVNI